MPGTAWREETRSGVERVLGRQTSRGSIDNYDGARHVGPRRNASSDTMRTRTVVGRPAGYGPYGTLIAEGGAEAG